MTPVVHGFIVGVIVNAIVFALAIVITARSRAR
jgi:tetrahydromethanopterin S-methyltransferase subunit B